MRALEGLGSVVFAGAAGCAYVWLMRTDGDLVEWREARRAARSARRHRRRERRRARWGRGRRGV